MEPKPIRLIRLDLAVFFLVVVLAFFLNTINTQSAIASNDNAPKATVYHIAEIISYDDNEKILKLHLFFDAEGNLAPHTEEIRVTSETVITDGEQALPSDTLKADMSIDVEYLSPTDSNNSSLAKYIFVH